MSASMSPTYAPAAQSCRRQRRGGVFSVRSSCCRLLACVAACVPLCASSGSGGGGGIQHFENLVFSGSFHPAVAVGEDASSSIDGNNDDEGGTLLAAAPAEASASAGLKHHGGSLRGPVYTEIASIIASASRHPVETDQEHEQQEQEEQEHEQDEDVAEAADSGGRGATLGGGSLLSAAIIDVPECADTVGPTGIRINGQFAPCAKLEVYCAKYQQVKDACPATCGLCDDAIAHAAAAVLEYAGDSGAGSASSGDAAPTTTTTTTTTTETPSADLGGELQGLDDDSEMSIQHEQAPINGTDAGDAEAKVADLEPEPLMTPEEHVIALTLLLKQVSMENEHLKLSMSQCEADVLDLKMRLIAQHSEKR